MFNVRLAGGHQYGKQLFTWLSLVVSLMASFCGSFFPLDVLDEIWDLIGSVSGGFLSTLAVENKMNSMLNVKSTLSRVTLQNNMQRKINVNISSRCDNKSYNRE